MHHVARRPPSPEEKLALLRTSKADPASWSCILVFTLVLIVAFSGIGALVGFFKGMMLQRALILATLGLLIGGVMAIGYWRYERGRRRQASFDVEDMAVEEISVECSNVVQCVPACDDADDPSFCVDLGDGNLLLLRGQWLMDPERLGAPEGYDPGEEGADTSNFLPEPYSFPRSEFTVTRAPHTGDVLGFELRGRYLAPSTEVDVLKRDYEIRDCLLLEGTLDDLALALERHHQ